MAAHGSGRASLRGDPGAPAGTESGGCLEAARREPGRAWRAEPWPALPGAAAVRVLGAAPVGRRAARAELRTDGRVRGRDRASTLGAVRARTGRRGRASAVVHVRRAYANGRVKDTKTQLSRRAVPLQAIALEALDELRAAGGRACCCFRTHAAATSTSATSTAGTGNRCRKESGSSRCATSTTFYATFALRAGVRPLHGSWARASR